MWLKFVMFCLMSLRRWFRDVFVVVFWVRSDYEMILSFWVLWWIEVISVDFVILVLFDKFSEFLFFEGEGCFEVVLVVWLLVFGRCVI